MPRQGRYTAPQADLENMIVWDDFTFDQTDLIWVDTISDVGTAAVGDNRKGLMVLTPADATVTDNDEVYLGSSNEVFLFLAGKPIYGRCLLQFTETAAGIYNCFFGFANAFAADLMINDGGGMRASGSLAAIYKVDGETVWRCTARVGSTVTITQSTTSAGGA